MRCTLCGEPAVADFVAQDGTTTGVARCQPHILYPLTGKDFEGACLERYFGLRRFQEAAHGT